MCEVKDIAEQIEKIRKDMNELLKEKSDLLDPEVVAVSQMLDSVLNEYYRILNQSMDK
ncbi:aspartyl-phosphate phosphatase Spo0E family protein [Sporanaerobacter acetigenes]|uniref:Spo0E like sporulation regulatory protein n=1 Tax=Sporanaerobacter acetigenes DSM 13106 TaxID=1123281 RepID=A0A1M5U1Y4_9FIRM|nr:aspartyl-phosphate phosphatase Spo0E family protein [Sporanaerobacter acetigenes]SHH56653.1 Spo0E like sporulation regulatory protein [Sporanaerobacter acetigenes DSM 13106]